MSSGYIDLPVAGTPSWKDPVATAPDLPATGNKVGDARVVEDTSIIYVWDGAAWQNTSSPGAGVNTLAAVGSSPNANAATITGTTLNLQPADATHPGVVTTGAQTIAGAKSFTSAIATSSTVNILDTSAAHYVDLKATSSTALTADRTITIDVKNASRAFNLQGDLTVSSAATVSGTNTGDLTLAAVGSSPSANAAVLTGQSLALQPFDSTHPGVATASGGGTTNFLRADNTWQAPAATSNSFATMVPISGTSPVAATPTDTLTFTSTKKCISIVGDSTAKSLDFDYDPIACQAMSPFFIDDFDVYVAASTQWTVTVAVSGSFAPIYDSSVCNGHPGVNVLQVGANNSAKAGFWSPQRCIVFDATVGEQIYESLLKLVAVPDGTNNYTLISGFSDYPQLASVSYGAYFLVDRSKSTTNWQCVCRSAITPTETVVDSGVAMSTNWVKLRVWQKVDGHVYFYINGTQVANISTNVPSNTQRVNLSNGLEVVAQTGAQSVDYDYVMFQNKLTVSR